MTSRASIKQTARAESPFLEIVCGFHPNDLVGKGLARAS
jgi:hypothetical protein